MKQPPFFVLLFNLLVDNKDIMSKNTIFELLLHNDGILRFVMENERDPITKVIPEFNRNDQNFGISISKSNEANNNIITDSISTSTIIPTLTLKKNMLSNIYNPFITDKDKKMSTLLESKDQIIESLKEQIKFLTGISFHLN